MPDLIEAARRWLEEHGYEVQDSSGYTAAHTEFWQVTASNHDGRSMLAQAPTQVAAWEMVCRAAGIELGAME